MGFRTDLLIIDFETTGLDPDKHDPIQVAALRLDKDTLQEKASFSSYIKPTSPERLWDFITAYAREVNKIPLDTIADAPDQKTVLRRLIWTLFTDEVLQTETGKPEEERGTWVWPESLPVLLTGQNVKFDYGFLLKVHANSGAPRDMFGYHTLELGSIHEFLKAVVGLPTKGRSLVDQADHFGLDRSGAHDALTDCRLTAEVLRRYVGMLTDLFDTSRLVLSAQAAACGCGGTGELPDFDVDSDNVVIHGNIPCPACSPIRDVLSRF